MRELLCNQLLGGRRLMRKLIVAVLMVLFVGCKSNYDSELEEKNDCADKHYAVIIENTSDELIHYIDGCGHLTAFHPGSRAYVHLTMLPPPEIGDSLPNYPSLIRVDSIE